ILPKPALVAASWTLVPAASASAASRRLRISAAAEARGQALDRRRRRVLEGRVAEAVAPDPVRARAAVGVAALEAREAELEGGRGPARDRDAGALAVDDHVARAVAREALDDAEGEVALAAAAEHGEQAFGVAVPGQVGADHRVDAAFVEL